MPGDRLVARQAELEQIALLLDALESEGLSALSLTGPAGIGKTTVWREGVEQALARGFTVLSSRPSQAEARLSYAGLADLLSSVEVEDLDALPPVPRRALDIALLRADVGSGRVERRAVATALQLLLEQLSDPAPVLIAIDDAQWLDVATEQVLAFATRRVEASPVGILVSVRVEDSRPSTFELMVPPGRRRELELGPLSAAALHEILKGKTGRTFARPLLVQIATACGGNPFYALEIARELDRADSGPTGRLPVPGEMRNLVRRRLERLPQMTRQALLEASCLAQPTTTLVDVEALEPAEAAAIVRVEEGGRIAFLHPLFASAVYESATSERRRQTHMSLAGRVTDNEERARHLALGSASKDESIARALETAATHSANRGAPSSAAQLARLALRLTPDDQVASSVRRQGALGNLYYVAGDLPAAIQTLEAVREDAPLGPARSQALVDLGGMYTLVGTPRSGVTSDSGVVGIALIDETLSEITDPLLAARAHARRAWVSGLDLQAMVKHSRAALELIDEQEAPGVYSFALQHLALGLLFSGESAEHALIERSLAGQEHADEWTISSVGPRWPLFFDDFATARSRHLELLARATESGNEAERQSALAYLGLIELWTGNPLEARDLADESLALAEQTEQEPMACVSRYVLGLVDLHLGQLGAARNHALRTLSWLGPSPPDIAFIVLTQAYTVLGSVALLEDAFEEADRWFTLADDTSSVWPEPAPFRFHPDHVEAVIALGDLQRAERLLVRLERRADRIPRPWLCAVAARSRGRLLAAQGDLGEAIAALENALDHHKQLDMPTEHARTLLTLGQFQRRRKQRRAARELLQRALSIFESVRAPIWAEQARAELARIPVRRATAELTPTEAEIARLAANGLTNKAIAEQAFVSLKTVEANIARIYRKLGINSRAQLARTVTEGPSRNEPL